MRKIFAAFLLLTAIVIAVGCTSQPEPAVYDQVCVVSADNLIKETHLYASLSPLPQEDPVEAEEDPGGILSNFSLETIISMILLIITTVFGTFWRKIKTKFGDAVDLLEVVVTALEDDKLSATEIANIKQRYRALVGKT